MRRLLLTAALTLQQAVLDEHKRVDALADEKVGPSHIEIPSKVEPGKTVRASCWWDIERAVPRRTHPKLYAKYNQLLEERQAARAAIIDPLLGDRDEAVNEICGPEFEARDNSPKLRRQLCKDYSR